MSMAWNWNLRFPSLLKSKGWSRQHWHHMFRPCQPLSYILSYHQFSQQAPWHRHLWNTSAHTSLALSWSSRNSSLTWTAKPNSWSTSTPSWNLWQGYRGLWVYLKTGFFSCFLLQLNLPRLRFYHNSLRRWLWQAFHRGRWSSNFIRCKSNELFFKLF